MSSDTSLRAVRGDGAAPGRTGGPNRWLALIVLSLAQLMVILDSTIVNIALPTAQHALGFSTDDRQWVVTGYALAFGSLLLPGGRLCDFFGRRRLFIIGVSGFAVASAAGGAANGFALLLAARVAQGGFAAMLAPAALSMLSVTFAGDANERGRAFGIFGAISGAGGALGLLLGGVLTQDLSWRWCLYVNLIIAAAAFAGALAFLRDGGRPERVRLDVRGTVVAVLSLVGLVYGLGNAESRGWTDFWTLGPVIAGGVLLMVFVLIERRASHPLLPLRVVLDRVRGTAYLAVGISGTGMFAVFLFLTYYLEETLGFTPIETGAAFLPMIGAVMVTAVFSGSVLLPRTGPRPLVPVGCVLSAAGLAMLTGIAVSSSYAGGVLPALLVTGLGFGMIFGPVQNAATSAVSPGEAGVASAMVNTAQQIGGSIGTAVFSSLSATAVTGYLGAHAATARRPATIADATLAGYHGCRVKVRGGGPRQRFLKTPGCAASAREPEDSGVDAARAMSWFLPEDAFRTICVSRPGYLGTPLDPADPSNDRESDLLAAVLDAAGVARAGVLAWSGGGPAAYRLAVRHPERVSAVVAIAAVSARWVAPRPTAADRLMFGTGDGGRLAAFLSRRAPGQVVGGALASEGSVRGAELRTLTRQAMADPEQRRLILEVALTVNTVGEREAGWRNDVANFARIDSLSLSRVRCPVLLVHGDADTDASVDYSRSAHAELPDSTLVVMEHGTHLAFYAHPQAHEVQEQAQKWLSDRT